MRETQGSIDMLLVSLKTDVPNIPTTGFRTYLALQDFNIDAVDQMLC